MKHKEEKMHKEKGKTALKAKIGHIDKKDHKKHK